MRHCSVGIQVIQIAALPQPASLFYVVQIVIPVSAGLYPAVRVDGSRTCHRSISLENIFSVRGLDIRVYDKCAIGILMGAKTDGCCVISVFVR